MGRLTAAAVVLAVAVSCVSSPVPLSGPGPTGVPDRRADPARPRPEAESAASVELPRPPDLARWPSGWVSDPAEGPRLGLAGRFWSDQRLLWLDGLDPAVRPSGAVRRLEAAFRGAGSPEEAFRAAWHLKLLYAAAGLADEARTWLDRAAALAPENPLPRLDRLWDQAYRLGDPAGARTLWPTGGFRGLSAGDSAKAALLRQKLSLGADNLGAAGADPYVSFLTLDRDDLWIGTWNGAVVRRSLATGGTDLLLKPAQVAPIVRLTVTGWFVYAFQDQALLRYSKVTGTWRSFAYPPGWTGLRVTGAVAEGEESLLIGSLGQGLWRWDHGAWSPVDTGGSGPFVTAVGVREGGGILLGTKDRGLWSGSEAGWSPVGGPRNISVLAPGGPEGAWAVGTWGEGAWVWSEGRLVRSGPDGGYVSSAAWSAAGPLWGLVDEGLAWDPAAGRVTLGPRDGVPAGGVTALVVREGRWIWGTMGQGLAWWSENEDPTVLR